ncbi:hypothetical protein AB0442_36265 [Kitasatospora sp. NPDC085895]|uniref:hypothetical protein n=1 Tax=Kitasatospora sp. NPDC085895 TaxID=3155057 RepID=UPI00344EF8BD
MNRPADIALRLAVTARQLADRTAHHVLERARAHRDAPDSGEINIPTVMWIVGSVVFAVAALAAFKALADKHLNDLKGL